MACLYLSESFCIRAGEPEPRLFCPLEPEPIEEKNRSWSRSRSKKGNCTQGAACFWPLGAGAAWKKKITGVGAAWGKKIMNRSRLEKQSVAAKKLSGSPALLLLVYSYCTKSTVRRKSWCKSKRKIIIYKDWEAMINMEKRDSTIGSEMNLYS